jgi:hypothetical protein
MVLVDLSVYSPSVRSLWMGVLVIFRQPLFPLSVMFPVVGRACVEVGICSVEVLPGCCVSFRELVCNYISCCFWSGCLLFKFRFVPRPAGWVVDLAVLV